MEAAKTALEKVEEDHRFQMSSFNYLYEKVLVHKMGLRSFLSSDYSGRSHVSKIPLANLQLTTLIDLPANTHAKGHYVLLRTIVEPIWNTAYLITCVEDHVGSVVLVNLFHFVCMELESLPRESLPLGTVLILKEPTMCTTRPGFVINCHSPTDIIIVQRHSQHYDKVKDIVWKSEIQVNQAKAMPRTPSAWKVLGNLMFKDNRYLQALEAYYVGLKMLVPGKDDEIYKTLHLNLASTHLRLGAFESALTSCMLVLHKQSDNKKALYRAGRACYEIRRFKESGQYFTSLMSIEFTNKDAIQQVDRCLQRLEESKGNVNIPKLYRDSLNHPTVPADCADYLGPVVTAYYHNKGRKLIANKNIPPGTLLIISKALAAFWVPPAQAEEQARDVGCSLDTFKQDRIITYLTHLVMKNPNAFGKLVNTMYLYDKPLGKKVPKLYCDMNTKDEVIVDTLYIQQIVEKTINIDKRDIMDEDKSGLHVYPYYMSQGCMTNVYWNTFNDVMIVHSVKFIREGEEIVATPYANRLNTDVYTQRLTYLRRYPIDCDCELCKLDEAEAPEVHGQRLRYYDLYQGVYAQLRKTFSADNLERLQYLIAAIDHTYTVSDRCKFKLALFHPFISLASVLMQQRRLDDVLDILERSLEVFGSSIESLQRCVENSREGIRFPKTTYVTCRFVLVADMICTYYEYKDDKPNATLWYKYFIKLDKLFTMSTLYNESAPERKREKKK